MSAKPEDSSIRLSREQFEATVDLRDIPTDHAYDETLIPSSFAQQLNESMELPSVDRVVLKGQLAEGGMGIVRVGEQTALRREVAVKTLRDEFLDERFVRRMLREARITGLVEHPNIVPIYSVQADPRNVPMIVMKRIEGVAWRTLILNPKHPEFPEDASDPLAWHLEVLMEVCNALRYAHSRGVLHLDLKPDNVMIGRFREIYVVDWGVAASMWQEHRGFVPMVDEISEVVGTPAYMAPEMVIRGQHALSERTDVFLLGATLYEILTGRAPHQGSTVQDALYSAHRAEDVEFGSEVPAELVKVAKRAMASNPADRFESIEAFRSAISGYMRHRGSLKLSKGAFRVFERFKHSVDSIESDAIDEDESARRFRSAQRLFGQCRFGFAQALRDWPGNPEAHQGLIEAMSTMASLYVERGDAASAEVLLDDIEDIEGEVVESLMPLREKIARLRADAARMERISIDQDPKVGSKARARYVLIAVLFLNVPLISAWLFQQRGLFVYEFWHSLSFIALVSLSLGISALIMGPALMPNRASKRFVSSIVVLTFLMLGQRVFTWYMGIDTLIGVAPDLFVFGVGSAIIAIYTDLRLLTTSIAFMGSSILCLFYPQEALLWVSVASLLGPGATAAFWLLSTANGRVQDQL